MDIPPSGMVDHIGSYLQKSPDDRLYGRLDAIAPKCAVPGHLEQIAGKTSDQKLCPIQCKSMAPHLVRSKGIFSLFDPVFDLGPPVDRDYPLCLHLRVGHNQTNSKEEFTHMPFNFANNPSGYTPFLYLVVKLDHLNLCAALSKTIGGSLRGLINEPL